VRRVLFDENVPRKLRRDLPDFSIRTAQEQGWSAFKNGQLLALAVREFEVLVTIDQRMKYQQNFQKLPIGIVVIDTRDTRFESIRAHVEELREAIARVKPGEMISVPRTA
jgi:predicted nuclease of predicted toxin-antitoxin system